MIALDIAHHRLYNQRIVQKKSELPSQVVARFEAMQAQDYAGVKWAIVLRCCSATDATIEQAGVNKTIVRTWLMRGTLQVVTAADVRWMLELLAPRIIANRSAVIGNSNLTMQHLPKAMKPLAKCCKGASN